jgi:hypothetical protein
MDDWARLAAIEYEIERFRKKESDQWTWEDMLAEIAHRCFDVALSEPRPVHRLDIAGPPNTFTGTGSAKVDNFIRDDLGPAIRGRESPYRGLRQSKGKKAIGTIHCRAYGAIPGTSPLVGLPDFPEVDAEVLEGRKRDDLRFLGLAAQLVRAIRKRVAFDRVIAGIDNPVKSHVPHSILFELIAAINLPARWTKHFDTKVGRTFHRFLANQVQTALLEIQKVGATYVVLTEDRVHIGVNASELAPLNMAEQ